MSYNHFTSFQRNEVSGMLQVGARKKDMARALSKHRSTIWRELNRNKTKNKSGYDAEKAKERTKERRVKANSRFRKLENRKRLREYVIEKIQKYWSPEQISGRLKKEYPGDRTMHIGKDSIYGFIYQERPDLTKYMRCRKGKYRRRRGTKIRERRREEAKKKRIDDRPEVANNRERIGDWEGDTIVGKEKRIHILTHNERRSGMVFADKLERATAEMTKEKTVERFGRISRDKKCSITYDNGTTFAEHELTEKETDMDIYFAYPYHSWERGSNENANGLLRQFFPKKSEFAKIEQTEIEEVVELLNDRPRKRLNYLTPAEVFYGRGLARRCCTLG